MTLHELLQALETRNISIGLKDGRLFIGARPQEIGDDLLGHLRLQRDALEKHFVERAAKAAQQPITAHVSKGERCPLSSSQQGLWLIDHFNGGISTQYHMPQVLELGGALDLKLLHAALLTVVRRHEVLRTVYASDGDTVWQEVHEVTAFELPVDEITPQTLEQAVEAECARPFALGSDLPLRGRVLRLSDERHVLVLVMHHIASDGWSSAILVRECCEAYAALAQGRTLALPALPVQYADYAYWQQQEPQQARHAQQLRYWEEKLAGLPTVHSLPLDYPRPTQQSFRGALHRSRLDAELSARLVAACRVQGATLFMGLHAVFSALLSRYSGADDIAIGTPIANREQPEVAALIGFFVNTLVLRVQIDGEGSFADLLRQCRETGLAAYAHQQLPFNELVEALNPARSLSYSALFQVMLSLQNNEQESGSLAGLSVTPMESAQRTAQFDLTLDVKDDGAGLAMSWIYCSDLFTPATIRHMADSFVCLLEAALAAPDAPMARLSLIDGVSRAALLDAGRATLVPAEAACLHQAFALRAAAQPAAVALIDGERQWSYGELERAANGLAQRLQRAGAMPGTRVGLCLERSAEVVVGILAILKCGASYVPLDPIYPGERIAFMLGDAAISIVLAQASTRHLVAKGCDVLLLDDGAMPEFDGDWTPVAGHADDQAYVIYTSGSTGQPKGVMVSHANVARLFSSTAPWYRFNEQDCWCLFHSYAFDFSVWEIWGALLHGGRLVVVPRAVAQSTPDFYQLVRDQRVTVLNQTPSAFYAFIEQDQLTPTPLALRTVVFGGEALALDKLQPWFERHSDMAPELVNMYGITETTVHVSYRRIRQIDAQGNLGSLIGRPIPDLTLWLLDAWGEPVPTGVVGELCVGGAGVAGGYLNRPELTAERFVAHPELGAGERLYRSGDLARYTHDGELEYLGRSDHQVKIRGFRIELGDIESALRACTGVADAVVLADSSPAGTRLVAYVQGAEDGCDSASLRTELAVRLPDYMVPVAFVAVDHWPLTANGKLDKAALPRPEMSAARIYVAPRGQVEETIAQVWCTILGLERVGRDEHFFALGGHSMLLVRMTQLLRQQGFRLDARSVYGAATLADLALLVSNSVDHVTAPCVSGIPEGCTHLEAEMVPLSDLTDEELARIERAVEGGAEAIQDIYPLSSLQAGMLFHHSLQTEGDAYQIRSVYAFSVRSTLDQFVDALQTVVARHDIFRTSFHSTGLRQAQQVVQRRAVVPIQEITLSQGGDPLAALLDATDPQRIRLDLTRAPLLRLQVIYDLDNRRWLLAMLDHHLISDNYTLQLISNEIEAVMLGRAHELMPSWPYRQFMEQILKQDTSQQELHFKAQLADVVAPTAPYGLMDILGEGDNLQEVRAVVQASLAASLRETASHWQVSTAVLFHVAWALVVARTSGHDDVVFGTVLSGRQGGAAGIERAMGLFINTLPLRVALKRRSAEEVVAETAASLAQLLSHEQMALALAQRCSGIPTGLPLFTALLNYRHVRLIEGKRDPAAAALWDGIAMLHSEERSNYPLGLSVDDHGDGFLLTLQAHCGLDCERILGYVQAALAGLCQALREGGKKPIQAIDILSSSEREKLLYGFNVHVADTPQVSLVHEMFALQARLSPDALALDDGERQLTFHQLDLEANRWAQALQERGVGPERLVAVFLERGINMVIAMLAVLKAGGAFVPIDPRYPSLRIANMLDDVSPTVLFSTSSLASRVEQSAFQVLAIDVPLNGAMEIASAPAVAGIGPQSLAYVIFTSGSTGRPKGVMVEHGSVCNLIAAQALAFGVDGQSRVLQYASPSFDACVSEVFVTLCSGASLHLVAAEVVLAGPSLVDVVQERQITLATIPPAVLSALDDPAPLACIRTLVIAGEAAPSGLAQRWAKGRRLINAYGPTEATVCASMYECESGIEGVAPIGTPMANVKLYVLDALLQPVPLGVAGELYIGGAGVARGYLGQPDLTAERFLADPFSDLPRARMYRTGDLVCQRVDGNLDYIGRNDQQVKIRGIRIELGEIAECLRIHPQVLDAIAVIHRSTSGATQLLAYFCDRPGVAPAPIDVLRMHLEQNLAAASLPAALVRLAALPLTVNGKLDRSALPAPEDDAFGERSYSAPTSQAEERIVAIWSSLLGVSRIGRDDNFFQLGGHSLLAIELVAHLHQAGLECSIAQLYKTPTPAGLAASCASQDTMAPTAPTASILMALSQPEMARIEAQVLGGSANIKDVFPLTALQEGILYHSIAAEQGDAYLLQTLLAFDNRARLDGYLDALRLVIARHDALRTAVLWEGINAPVQVVLREVNLCVDEWHAGNVPDVEAALRQRYDPGHMRVNLNQAPLMHAAASFDPVGGRWLLVLLCHHLVLDHTTLEIVLDEVRAILRGQASALLAPPSYGALISASLEAAQRPEHIHFFSNLLGTLTEATLPYGLSDIQTTGNTLRSASVKLDSGRVTRLKAQAQALGVSAASLMHLAWCRVLATLADRSDVVFGTVLFGRSRADGARAVGLMVNTLPFRLELAELSVRDGVLASHALLAQLIEREMVSLSNAQRCSGMSAQSALFSSLFNYRYSAPDSGETNVTGLEGVIALSSAEFSNYPLNTDVDDHGDTMSLTVQIVQPFDPLQVACLFDTCLSSLVNALDFSPQTTLLSLDIIPSAERAVLLQLGSGEDAFVPVRGLHHSFEDFVRSQPQSIAVLDGEISLSYEDVDRQARLIALALHRNGVGDGDRVGLHLERSWRVPVAILGILKAGASYVPLDVGQPPERLAFYLEDSRPSCILVDGLPGDWVGVVPCLDFAEASVETADSLLLANSLEGAEHAGDAYVVYTSGTTGKPKGVVVGHYAMQHRLLGWQRRLGLLEKPPRVMQMAGLSVDICFGDMLKALGTGGELVICPNALLLDPAGLFDLFQRTRASFGDFVPAVLRELVTYASARGLRLDYLQHILVGSESWYGADLSALQTVLAPQARVFNAYGQTESIIDVSLQDVTALQLATDKVVPIGRPLPNTRMLVLDRHVAIQPLDVPGELYIGGPGLASGYLDREELTAERFVHVAGVDGLVYRTGDFARFNSDGTMDFLGRADQQIKIRGFRVELQEIEAALQSIEGIRNAVVVLFERSPGDSLLVAHIEWPGILEGSQGHLRQALKSLLPEYMVPACLMFCTQLPLLASGKVDRKSLPEPVFDLATGDETADTESEQLVASLWQELLQLAAPPGRYANFFELGGHSLLGVRFVTRCREQLEVNLAIKDLFMHATVWEMGAWIDLKRALTYTPDSGLSNAVGDEITVTEW